VPGDNLLAWLAKTPEDAIDPEQPIVDPHHHLWDRRPRQDLPEGTRSHQRYLGDELIEDIRGGGHNVIDTVFVECRAMYREDADDPLRSIGEVEFVQGVAAMAASGLYGEGVRCCGGIVGFANLTLGDAVEPVLSALMGAGANFRGIRHAHGWHASPDIRNSHHGDIERLLGKEDFRAGFAVLDKLGLTFDCWGFHTQLEEVADLAAAFPGVTIIVNHIGGPMAYGPYEGQRETTVFEDWKRGIATVAKSSNVVVKVGGCGMPSYGFGHEQSEDGPPASDVLAAAWRPYFEFVLEHFGADRCMFESNFPVDKVSCSYTGLWNAFKIIAGELGLSRDEKNAMFYSTAAQAYSLELSV
jgi:predicted TIM-barrel fold metal-dependent hydrolase